MTKTIVQLLGSKILLAEFEETDLDQTYADWLNDPEVVKYCHQRFRKHTYESCEQYSCEVIRLYHLM